MRIARILVVGLGMATLAAQADLAWGTTYVVLPLIGNQLTVVSADISTGTSMDKNRHETFATKTTDLDLAALRAADAAIHKAQPNATITMMLPSDPALYALNDQWLAANAIDGPALVARLKGQLGTGQDTHLIVLLPYRAEPLLATRQGHIGTGKVAGLGFYVNTFQKLCKGSTSECERGFLAPFVNFRMTMLDAQTGAEESEEYTAVGVTRSAARADDRTAWNAVPDAQKIAFLEALLRQEVYRLMPDLLAKRHH